ncbi:MAG: hypothetical protein HY801_06585 [Candidatus Lindowbacteria bacterium]|nr:hypothetical protein [Candidatus Lindowbacteria bacterium]
MFPIIEVECPFCKATGQIMAPPLGSIVVGPCPRCGEMVLLYNGTVMPLDKNIMTDGTIEEKKQHLLETIVDMVAVKVDEVVENDDMKPEPKQKQAKKGKTIGKKRVSPSVSDRTAPPISREDIRDFVSIDLHLIDSRSYFEKVFGKKKSEIQ